MKDNGNGSKKRREGNRNKRLRWRENKGRSGIVGRI